MSEERVGPNVPPCALCGERFLWDTFHGEGLCATTEPVSEYGFALRAIGIAVSFPKPPVLRPKASSNI